MRCCRTNFPLRSKFAAERGVEAVGKPQGLIKTLAVREIWGKKRDGCVRFQGGCWFLAKKQPGLQPQNLPFSFSTASLGVQ